MSPLARTSPASLRLALRRSPKQVRGFGLHPLKEHTAHHVSRARSPTASARTRVSSPLDVRSTDLQNMPFTYDNRRKFAVRYAGAAATFFSIPFIAVAYQL
ncbi:hypothetical protein OH77DRAFT_1422856 [Trametes cingulata]|nr:hypothetical protein OH77DRAFT_1422856 [Trametes cingulata]